MERPKPKRKTVIDLAKQEEEEEDVAHEQEREAKQSRLVRDAPLALLPLDHGGKSTLSSSYQLTGALGFEEDLGTLRQRIPVCIDRHTDEVFAVEQTVYGSGLHRFDAEWEALDIPKSARRDLFLGENRRNAMRPFVNRPTLISNDALFIDIPLFIESCSKKNVLYIVGRGIVHGSKVYPEAIVVLSTKTEARQVLQTIRPADSEDIEDVCSTDDGTLHIAFKVARTGPDSSNMMIYSYHLGQDGLLGAKPSAFAPVHGEQANREPAASSRKLINFPYRKFAIVFPPNERDKQYTRSRVLSSDGTSLYVKGHWLEEVTKMDVACIATFSFGPEPNVPASDSLGSSVWLTDSLRRPEIYLELHPAVNLPSGISPAVVDHVELDLDRVFAFQRIKGRWCFYVEKLDPKTPEILDRVLYLESDRDRVMPHFLQSDSIGRFNIDTENEIEEFTPDRVWFGAHKSRVLWSDGGILHECIHSESTARIRIAYLGRPAQLTINKDGELQLDRTSLHGFWFRFNCNSPSLLMVN